MDTLGPLAILRGLAVTTSHFFRNLMGFVRGKPTIFTDKRVRLAMTHLIDRQRILDNIHSGLGEMVTGPFYSHGPFCDRSRTPQAAATVAGSSASAAPGPAITSSLRPKKLTPS